MAKSPSEIFNEKVNLIYEYNKKSPLFVHAANTEIENNNLEKAIEILQSGIKFFPKYSAAYFLLGKSFALVGNYNQAIKEIKIGSDLIHSQKSYDYYFKEIDTIRKQRSFFESNSRSSFFNNKTEPEIMQENLFETQDEDSPFVPKDESVDDRLEQIAKEISSAKISQPINTKEPVNSVIDGLQEEFMIVSETLAKIYVAQGELKEAIDVYKKLIKKNPHNTNAYLKRIDELNKELNS